MCCGRGSSASTAKAKTTQRAPVSPSPDGRPRQAASASLSPASRICAPRRPLRISDPRAPRDLSASPLALAAGASRRWRHFDALGCGAWRSWPWADRRPRQARPTRGSSPRGSRRACAPASCRGDRMQVRVTETSLTSKALDEAISLRLPGSASGHLDAYRAGCVAVQSSSHAVML